VAFSRKRLRAHVPCKTWRVLRTWSPNRRKKGLQIWGLSEISVELRVSNLAGGHIKMSNNRGFGDGEIKGLSGWIVSHGKRRKKRTRLGWGEERAKTRDGWGRGVNQVKREPVLKEGGQVCYCVLAKGWTKRCSGRRPVLV